MNVSYLYAFTFIYIAIVLRILVSTVFNNFEARKEKTLILSPDLEKMIRPLARFSLIMLTFFWPLFLLFYPKNFINAFIFSKKSAINKMNLIVGMKVGMTNALLKRLFNNLN